MTKRPVFWILFAVLSLASGFAAFRYFPEAFSIVALDVTMTRDGALAEARAIMTRDGLGPADFRQAASFSLDSETQTFVELEGGGKETFTAMLRDGLHAAYAWRVRHFREGETRETTIEFTPEGRLWGFRETVPEDAPGPVLEADAARAVAEQAAAARWAVDFGPYALVEHAQERRPNGRVDHRLTYERASPTLGEGRYRLTLGVSGDRLTRVSRFVWIPEAFSRRYENMRSANEAIGVGSAVAMALLYIVGGIGVGLFVLMRQRWVLMRGAVVWGVFVAALQALVMINSWPLAWMAYDTAVPRTTFFVQQIVWVVGVFVGMAVLLSLSFMAAESLTRRAFGRHPQLWRTWARGAGGSTTMLGLTSAGYLLVPVFMAYEVGLYLLATRTFGWWTPSEALLHPDVLATYVPWLEAIALSLQAGFWEECLFRAVPIAGAALLGARYGHRGWWIAGAFVVQAVIFGAGHAPYPTLPSYARLVELILPSIGFGLLYLAFGLVPAIVLHFAFDVVWFALPIFQTGASGWGQQAMVVLMAFVPLWVVLWRRVQARAWQPLNEADRNAAWVPPPPAPPEPAEAVRHYRIRPAVRVAWYGLAAAGLAVTVWAATSARQPSLAIDRAEAEAIARLALAERGATLGDEWLVMPVPDNGSGGEHEFVHRTAGEARRRELVGRYLPGPMWRVRVATFSGDVASRAEEWQVVLDADGTVRTVRHTLPEGRPGAVLDEADARPLAREAAGRRTGLDPAGEALREVSASPRRLEARTDWTFEFVDATEPLPEGEARVRVDLAGDELTGAGLFIFTPEHWRREQRAAGMRTDILRIGVTAIWGALLVAAAASGVIAWTRRRFAPGLFAATAGLMLVVTAAASLNGWPGILASLITAQPLPLQIAAVAGVGSVGLVLMAAIVGLAVGALPHRLASASRVTAADANRLGVAVGLVGAGVVAMAGRLQTPEWAQFATVAPLGTLVPVLDGIIDRVPGLLTQTAILATVLAVADRLIGRRWLAAAAALSVVGFLAAGGPQTSAVGAWLLAGTVTAVGLGAAYFMVLRADLTMVPLALGVMAAAAAMTTGLAQPYSGAAPASFAASGLSVAVGWWLARAIRRARDRAAV